MQLAFNVIRATVQVLGNGRWGEGRGGQNRKGVGRKKLSTFLLASNDMLENKSHLNKLCFTELGNKRCPNCDPRFASGTSTSNQNNQIMAVFKVFHPEVLQHINTICQSVTQCFYCIYILACLLTYSIVQSPS